jgi:hypothetical protein
MGGIERAQTHDMEMLTMYPTSTQQDADADFRYMMYYLPAEDVAEILDVVADGVTTE